MSTKTLEVVKTAVYLVLNLTFNIDPKSGKDTLKIQHVIPYRLAFSPSLISLLFL
jgi:hypothetical protein